MSKENNAVGNVAIGLAVVVLGFVVYKMFINPTMVSTSTPATAKQTSAAANPAALAAAVATGSNALANLFGSLNSNVAAAAPASLGGLDQTYTSTAYNPDQISADIGQDTAASMANAGESDLDSWGFSL